MVVTNNDDADLWDEVPPWEVTAQGETQGQQPDLDVDEFLNEDEPEYDWVIPEVLERTDRVVLTGGEGMGKSTLLRQIAVQAAAGIHPFTLEAMPPVRVMLLDLENSKRHVRRKVRPLRIVASELDPSYLRVRVKSEGIDLLNPIDEEWLEERIKVNQPDLLISGPVYKLASGDPTEERVARHVALMLDRYRIRYQFAVILEAHSPHPVAGGRRPERPYGASLWMRWPEFGLFLSPEGLLNHWRGARDERSWPAAMKRGGEWPWTPTEGRYASFAAIMQLARERNTGSLTQAQIAEEIGVHQTTVGRILEANRAQWDDLCRELGEF